MWIIRQHTWLQTDKVTVSFIHEGDPAGTDTVRRAAKLNKKPSTRHALHWWNYTIRGLTCLGSCSQVHVQLMAGVYQAGSLRNEHSSSHHANYTQLNMALC